MLIERFVQQKEALEQLEAARKECAVVQEQLTAEHHAALWLRVLPSTQQSAVYLKALRTAVTIADPAAHSRVAALQSVQLTAAISVLLAGFHHAAALTAALLVALLGGCADKQESLSRWSTHDHYGTARNLGGPSLQATLDAMLSSS